MKGHIFTRVIGVTSGHLQLKNGQETHRVMNNKERRDRAVMYPAWVVRGQREREKGGGDAILLYLSARYKEKREKHNKPADDT